MIMHNSAEAKGNRRDILEYIIRYLNEHSYPPNITEIASGVGVSRTTVRRHMDVLLEDGVLETESEDKDSRAYRIKGTKVVLRKQH